uniref:EF-hand domain-containing protein n=1 Tax=Nymphaea colorata TaxID=210225 RepID=A0A5K1A9M0_9MAGN
MRNVIINLGEEATNEEARQMINAADTDGDGLLSYLEFVKLMKAD